MWRSRRLVSACTRQPIGSYSDLRRFALICGKSCFSPIPFPLDVLFHGPCPGRRLVKQRDCRRTRTCRELHRHAVPFRYRHQQLAGRFAFCEHSFWRPTVRIITRGRLAAYIAKYPDARSGLLGWYAVSFKAEWRSLVDVRSSFPHADPVGHHCTVFNIHGGKYRLVTHIDYRCRLVFLRFFLPHAEYDKGVWKNDC